MDGPVDYVIMLAAPNTSDNAHLEMLSKLAANLMDDDFRETLKGASTVEEIKALFSSKKGGRVICIFLGVTSCPVGIAHTYMAASNLEKDCKEKKVWKIKNRNAGGCRC